MLIDASALPRPPKRLMPGVVHLPNFLELEQQAELVVQTREIARSVAGTPVAMRRPMVGKGQMKAHLLSLGWFWATNPYRLVKEVDGYPVPPVPDNFQGIANRVLAAARELDEDTQDRLYAMGPHPAEVLTTDELRDLLERRLVQDLL